MLVRRDANALIACALFSFKIHGKKCWKLFKVDTHKIGRWKHIVQRELKSKRNDINGNKLPVETNKRLFGMRHDQRGVISPLKVWNTCTTTLFDMASLKLSAFAALNHTLTMIDLRFSLWRPIVAYHDYLKCEMDSVSSIAVLTYELAEHHWTFRAILDGHRRDLYQHTSTTISSCFPEKQTQKTQTKKITTHDLMLIRFLHQIDATRQRFHV